MQYEKKIRKVGGSATIIIPHDLLKYLNLDIDDIIILQDDKGNHGKFASFWKKESTNDNTNTATKPKVH